MQLWKPLVQVLSMYVYKFPSTHPVYACTVYVIVKHGNHVNRVEYVSALVMSKIGAGMSKVQVLILVVYWCTANDKLFHCSLKHSTPPPLLCVCVLCSPAPVRRAHQLCQPHVVVPVKHTVPSIIASPQVMSQPLVPVSGRPHESTS